MDLRAEQYRRKAEEAEQLAESARDHAVKQASWGSHDNGARWPHKLNASASNA